MRAFQNFERQKALETSIFGKQSDDMKRLFENVGLDEYDLEDDSMEATGDDIEVTEVSDIEGDIDSDIEDDIDTEEMTESEIVEEIETKLSSIMDLLSKLKTV